MAPLDELRIALCHRAGRHIIIGMDANVEMSSMVDYCHVGPSVPDCRQDHEDLQRASILHCFLAEFGLCLVNTFADAAEDSVYTRTNWSGFGSSQYDFIASSMRIVDRSLDFSADHRLVYGMFGMELTRQISTERNTTVRNWKPAGTWDVASQELPWQWESWDETCDIWWKAARTHATARTS